MNKNVELATALSFVKDKLKISVIDAVAQTTERVGVQTSSDNWRRIRNAIEEAIENSVNGSHGAFRSLVK